ncbi:uncharacterized protein LOC142977762 isoform X2 [Anticarsia gemmatalis]
MEIVAELVYKKLSVYGTDLEAFAKHAKRASITSEDVKLLVRRCPSLKTHLNSIAPTAPNSKEKKRKTIASRQSETPTPKTREPEKSTESDNTISKSKNTDIPTSKKNTDIPTLSKNSDIPTLSKNSDNPTSKSKESESVSSLKEDNIRRTSTYREEVDSLFIDDDNMIDLTFD